jgi:hypothetical protein
MSIHGIFSSDVELFLRCMGHAERLEAQEKKK